MKSITIHTINGRDNVFFDVFRESSKITNEKLNVEIRNLHEELTDVLKLKGINYSELKSSLTPTADRFEAGFVFDNTSVGFGNYGNKIFKELCKFVDVESRFSVLHGDFIPRTHFDLKEELRISLIKTRDYDFSHPTNFYCVYINNLTERQLENLNNGLSLFFPYIGYIPTTFESKFKNYLSVTLTYAFLKFENIILQGHEDDLGKEINCNLVGFDFEDFGLTCKSIPNFYYMIFLTYKIERRVFDGYDCDSEISLISMSKDISPLDKLSVQVEEAKLAYLKANKEGKMKLAKLFELDSRELSDLITSKIKANYIYNLSYVDDYKICKFNIKLEIPLIDKAYPARLIASLEYRAQTKQLRLITLY